VVVSAEEAVDFAEEVAVDFVEEAEADVARSSLDHQPKWRMK